MEEDSKSNKVKKNYKQREQANKKSFKRMEIIEKETNMDQGRENSSNRQEVEQ